MLYSLLLEDWYILCGTKISNLRIVCLFGFSLLALLRTSSNFFQEWFPFGVTQSPVEGAFSIGWWCYITPVSSMSCLNIDFCQLFHWPKNISKPNLVFLHILDCTVRNTFLTNINLGRLSDIASHCKKYINIL